MDETTVETVEATVATAGGVPPVQPKADDGFSGKSGDIEKDLALLAAQQGLVQPQTQEAPTVQEHQQEPPQPATAEATPVPDKFKNPDGTPNVERITKSAESALAEYRKIEAQLRQAQNERAQLRQPQTPQNQAQAPIVAPNLSPLEASLANDLIQEAAGLGLQLDQKFAIAQARVMARGLEAKHQADVATSQDIRQEIEDQKRERQLTEIAKADPWVFSPEGIKTLSEIRQQYPEVNAAKGREWDAAYDKHLALEAKKQRLGGMVSTATPKAPTAKAPATPVGAAPRAVVKSGPDVNSMSADQLTAYAKGLSPAEEAKFWASRGLKF